MDKTLLARFELVEFNIYEINNETCIESSCFIQSLHFELHVNLTCIESSCFIHGSHLTLVQIFLLLSYSISPYLFYCTITFCIIAFIYFSFRVHRVDFVSEVKILLVA